ncbi:MAG TPA: CAP domain-containing protein [Clostridia bacterium]|nr:CAP domain-containing protein [Clostridia bacterium]
MKKSPLIILVIMALILSASCGRAAAKGSQSSISEMNNVTRLKVIFDQVPVRSGCSNNSSAVKTVSKDTRMDVLSKVADWYAVKLPNNDIGFIPQSQCTPVIPNVTSPGTTPNYSANVPGTTSAGAPGRVPGTKQSGQGAAQTNSNALTTQEQQMFNLVNQARAQAGVPALQIDMELTKMARIKSQDMIDNNYFSHNSPQYGSPFDMMKAFGINYVYAGENIAGNQTVDAAENALMNSPGHRKNILSPNFTHIGIGIRAGGQMGTMFTQDFISKPT